MEETSAAQTSSSDPGCCPPGARAIVAAVLTRVLFMGHVALSAWRSVTVNNSHYWWMVMGSVVAQIIEMIIIIVKRRGHEWKHFCFAVLIYLCGVVPCVWTVEINRLTKLNDPNFTEANSSNLYGISDQLILTDTEWAITIEQGMMCLLILGRWLLPKGEITRDQLSQVLLVYLGLAADIVELFEIFNEENVIADINFIYVVLGTYTWSLWQFTFIIIPPSDEQQLLNKDNKLACAACETNPFCQAEIFAILATMVFQDGPFFALRMCAIVLYGVSSYSNYFFIVKNALFLVMQSYRMCVIVCPCCDKEESTESAELVKSNKVRPVTNDENANNPDEKSLKGSVTPPVNGIQNSNF